MSCEAGASTRSSPRKGDAMSAEDPIIKDLRRRMDGAVDMLKKE